MEAKVIKKQVPRQKHRCTKTFVNLKLTCSLLMLMLHIAVPRWPLMSPWCYWLEKVQSWKLGSAFHILRSLLTSQLLSTIPSYPRASYHNKRAVLSDSQAWGCWLFTIVWEEFGCVASPCPSDSPSLSSRLNSLRSLSLASSERCSRPLIMFIAFHWTLASSSLSLFNWEALNWTQCGLTRTE